MFWWAASSSCSLCQLVSSHGGEQSKQALILTGALIHFIGSTLKTSSHFNYLSKAPPPNTITLGNSVSVWVGVLSRFWLFVTLWTPLFMGLSRQEYWSGLPCHSPGDLPGPGIEPVCGLLRWQVDSLPLCHLGNPSRRCVAGLVGGGVTFSL